LREKRDFCFTSESRLDDHIPSLLHWMWEDKGITN